MDYNDFPYRTEKRSDGKSLSSEKEQIFQELNDRASFYLGINLNDIDEDTITNDIQLLQNVFNTSTSDKTLSRVQKIIPSILKLFYKAQKRAVDEANRPDKYYDLMVDSLKYFKEIKDLLG